MRELESVVERTLLLADGDVIRLDGPPGGRAPARRARARPACRSRSPTTGIELEAIERGLILQALDKAGGNVTRAARLLGLSRRTLQYRLERIQAAPDGAVAAPDGAIEGQD